MTGNVCFRSGRPCDRICSGAIPPEEYAAFQAGKEWDDRRRKSPGLGSAVTLFGDEDGPILIIAEPGIFSGSRRRLLPEVTVID